MNVVTLSECVTRFSEAGIIRGDTVIVHGSLKAVGWINGGANTIVDALLQVIGTSGTLIVSAHSTQNLDPGLLDQAIDPQTAETLRLTQAPFRGKATHLPTMGAITAAVQLDERSTMSDHPTCAVLAIGKNAQWITADHALSPAFGENSPYAKAAQLNAKVILIGVDYAVISALHTAQVMTQAVPWCIHSVLIGPLDTPHRVKYLDLAYTTTSFNTIGLAYESTVPVHFSRLGHAVLKCLELAPLLAFATTWMERNETA